MRGGKSEWKHKGEQSVAMGGHEEDTRAMRGKKG